MILDTSAIVAISRGEADADVYADSLSRQIWAFSDSVTDLCRHAVLPCG